MFQLDHAVAGATAIGSRIWRRIFDPAVSRWPRRGGNGRLQRIDVGLLLSKPGGRKPPSRSVCP